MQWIWLKTISLVTPVLMVKILPKELRKDVARPMDLQAKI